VHREVKLPISDSTLFVNTPIKYWIENQEIDEASGLAASYQNPHKFWVHNDSGGDNVLFLINAKGNGFQKLHLEGIKIVIGKILLWLKTAPLQKFIFRIRG
jgi:hypothetical protein